MVIPHLHFCGDCKEAIALYERAFHTRAEHIECGADGQRVAHASMRMQGQLVYLNDRFGNGDRTLDCAVHMIVTFETVGQLRACLSILQQGGREVDAFHQTPYSRLCGNVMDKFGVLWGLMADP